VPAESDFEAESAQLADVRMVAWLAGSSGGGRPHHAHVDQFEAEGGDPL
jgi:hypothetical protein